MSARQVVVLGAGPAGLAASLLLARAGHAVTLLERDDLAPAGQDPFSWERRGVPHFTQPHMLIPRACKELRQHAPDVYDALLSAGAGEIDVRARLEDDPRPGDEDLRYLAVRRPVLEAALRNAVLTQGGVEARFGTAVDGLLLEGNRVTGVRAAGTVVEAELVIDAMGRRSPVPGWLTAGGMDRPACRTSPCGVVYYSRYYRLRPGKALPPGPFVLGPRGDLGFMGFATFPGDDGTFAALLAVPPGVPALKSLKDCEAFDAAVARIPALRTWVDPALVTPLTPVLAMAGLQNSVPDADHGAALGLLAVGDALSHTDPTLAHGIAFALVHAGELVHALREHTSLEDLARAFRTATAPALRERFELASALGAQRLEAWNGGAVDMAHHDGAYALFSLAAGGAASLIDPEVLRVFVRRMGLLDSTRVLDDDLPMQLRIEQRFAELRSRVPAPPAPPTKEELLAPA